MIIYFFRASIPPSSLYSNHRGLQNHPGGKYLVRKGTESIPFLKQQRRPLPSLLSLSFCYDHLPPTDYSIPQTAGGLSLQDKGRRGGYLSHLGGYDNQSRKPINTAVDLSRGRIG